MSGARPRSVSGAEAGAACLGGWIAPDGRFYAAPRLHHVRVGAELRATGDGPADPWDMRDGWAMVRAHGEVVVRPDRVSQAQLDTLGDMLRAAPVGSYRSQLLTALRDVREMEEQVDRHVAGCGGPAWAGG